MFSLIYVPSLLILSLISEPMPSQRFRGLGPPPSSPEVALGQLVAIQIKTLKGYAGALESSLDSGPLRGVGPAFQRIGKRSKLDVLLVHVSTLWS